MLEMSKRIMSRPAGGFVEAEVVEALVPYVKEILSHSPEVVVDYLLHDLEEFECSGYASATLMRLLERAQCLADADRITVNFAA